MNGFYSLWTAPGKTTGASTVVMQDYELLMLILSVASYQKSNGPAKMYADEAALEYLESLSIDKCFKNGTELLTVPQGINPQMFWAAGKIEALRREQMPSVMIDTDLIVWKNLDYAFDRDTTDIAVIHREDITESTYPDPHRFRMTEEYEFPADWDFTVRPANTALLFIKDNGFKNRYVEHSMEFMRKSISDGDNLCHMVFAEQRILPMCAVAEQMKIYSFCDNMDALREQKLFTHFWGHKNLLKFNQGERMSYCRRMMIRLRNEFPDMYEVAASIEELRVYA